MLLLPGRSVGGEAEQSSPAIPGPVQTDLFIGRVGGYHTYRIPALIATTKGTVLAFAEGRKDSGSDQGHTTSSMRRSLDGGKTWTPCKLSKNDGTNALNNPTTVV